MYRNCFVKAGMRVFCSRCGKILLQDRYNYLKHLEKCDCAENNMSLKDEFSIKPLQNHSHGYIFRRRGNVLFFHVYELQLWDRDRLRTYLKTPADTYAEFYCEADPEKFRPGDDLVPLTGVWKKIFTATLRKNRTFAEKGEQSLAFWLSQGQDDETLMPLSSSDPLAEVRAFFPGFSGYYVWDLLGMQCRMLPYRKDLPKKLYPSSIRADQTGARDETALLSSDDIPVEEISFLAAHRNAACVTSFIDGGEVCLKVFCRTPHNRLSAPFIFIITGNHITSQIYFDRREVMLLGSQEDAPVHIMPGALEAFSAAHPEMMLDRYNGSHPLLPLLAPYSHSSYELLYKAGLSRLTDRLLKDMPDRYTVGSLLQLEEKSPGDIFSIPIRYLRKLEQLTDRYDFWSVFEIMRDLYEISPSFIDMDHYSKTYISFIKNLRINKVESLYREAVLRGEGHVFFAGGMGISQAQLLKWLRYTLLLDQMYPDQDNYRYLTDYLRICSDLGTFPYGLMPKDIKTAHDDAVMLYEMDRDRIQFEKFRKSVSLPDYRRLSTQQDEQDPKSPLHGQPYVVLLPQKPSDLEDESKQMHNCVKTYMKYVISGETRIVFLRSKTDPDKSLVTMEISRSGRLVQAKAFANRKVPATIQTYIRLWAKTKGIPIYTSDIDTHAA